MIDGASGPGKRKDRTLALPMRKIVTAAIVLGAGGMLMLGVLLMTPPHGPDEPLNGRGGPVETLPPDIPLDMGAPDGAGEAADLPSTDAASGPARVEIAIGRKETFYDALCARGVPHNDIMAVVKAAKGFRDLGKVKRGDHFWLEQHGDGGLERLGFDLDEESWAEYRREGDGYRMEQGSYPVERDGRHRRPHRHLAL